jgi:hypothetical protein
MFERPHHQRIARLLQTLDARLLHDAECYFAGGTAIALQLGEYRESVDVDFLCGSTAGYRLLREAVFSRDFAALVSAPVKTLRPLRTDQYGLRTFVEIDGVPIKFEIVREARIELAGAPSAQFGVPLLSREDLFAEKLLANVDRVNDRGTFNRDAIDLGMMREAWGPVPAASLQKAEAAYGPVVRTAVEEAGRRLSEPDWLAQCLTALSMSPDHGARAMGALRSWTATG